MNSKKILASLALIFCLLGLSAKSFSQDKSSGTDKWGFSSWIRATRSPVINRLDQVQKIEVSTFAPTKFPDSIPRQPRLVDTDRDGVPNTSDNCPHEWNPAQRDWDQDGIGDWCDTEELRVLGVEPDPAGNFPQFPAVTSIRITFSEDIRVMASISDEGNAAHYVHVLQCGDENCLSEEGDKEIPGGIAFFEMRTGVEFTPSQPLSTRGGYSYKIVVKKNLHTWAGNPLDGNQPNGDYVSYLYY